MSFIMFFAGLLGALIDPIRWAVCAAAGWFLPNFFLALLIGVGTIEAIRLLLSRALQESISGSDMLTQTGGLRSHSFFILLFTIEKKRKSEVSSQ